MWNSVLLGPTVIFIGWEKLDLRGLVSVICLGWKFGKWGGLLHRCFELLGWWLGHGVVLVSLWGCLKSRVVLRAMIVTECYFERLKVSEGKYYLCQTSRWTIER